VRLVVSNFLYFLILLDLFSVSKSLNYHVQQPKPCKQPSISFPLTCPASCDFWARNVMVWIKRLASLPQSKCWISISSGGFRLSKFVFREQHTCDHSILVRLIGLMPLCFSLFSCHAPVSDWLRQSSCGCMSYVQLLY